MNTKKILYTCLTVLMISFTSNAQNVADYFTDMPLNLIPTMESSYRLELVENYQTTKKDTLQNSFGSTMKLHSLDTIKQRIHVQVTSNSRFDMQLFKQNNDTVIGIINTVCGPICSSYIKFYDTEWNEKTMNLPPASAKNWIKSEDTLIDGTKITDIMKASFIEMSFNPTTKSIELKNNSLDFLSKDDKERLLPFVDDKIISLKWNGQRFLP